MSRLTGLRPGTLRNWEERYGLLEPERTRGGTRLYSEADVARIREVQHLLRANGNSVLAATRSLGIAAPAAGRRNMPAVGGLEHLFALAARAEVAIENARLLEKANLELKTSQRQAQALYEMARALTSSLELQPLLEEFCWQAVRSFQASGCVLLLLDGTGDLVTRATAGIPLDRAERFRALRISATSKLAATALRTGETQVVVEASHDARTNPQLVELFQWQSLIVAPLLSRGRLSGILALGHSEPRYFAATDRETATTLASQASVAISHAQTYEALQERQQLAEVERAVATAASASLALGDVLQAICRESVTALGADRVSVWLVGESGALERAAESGTPAPATATRLVAMGSGLADLTLGTGLRLADLARMQEPGPPAQGGDVLAQYGIADLIMVPFGCTGRLTGILAISDLHEFGRFGQAHVDIAEAIARHAQVAIANALAFRDQQRAIARLDELNHMKSNFLTTMRHELRTPLNAILGFSELLQNRVGGELSPKQEHYVDNVRQAGGQLLRLIDDILEYSKVQSSDQLEQESFRLGALVEEVAASFAARAQAKSVMLAVEVEAGLPVIRADRTRLGWALRQLIDSALKFTESGGRVRVAARRADCLEIAVTDSGAGIAAADHARIFQPFVQGDGSHSRGFEGTGLGLAIAARILELHGGSVALQSAPGQGSTFTLRLPLPAQDAAHPQGAAA